jgi:Uma2 family endonuclease
MSASAPEPVSESKGKTKAKIKPNPSAKTETESSARTNAKGQKRTDSGHREQHAHTFESKLAPAVLRKEEPRNLEPNGYIVADASITVPPELDVQDLPGAPTSPPKSRAKSARLEKEEAVFRKLDQALVAFITARKLGEVICDAQFDWSESHGLELCPDLAYVSLERWAGYRHEPQNHVQHVVPDLVVEIIRSSEQTELLCDWLEAYFRSGVNRVWIVFPELLKIYDHDSLSSSRILGRDDVIDGRSILPGFQLPVNELLAGR